MVLVDEVHLPVVRDSDENLRSFQKEFIDCAKNTNANVIQLIAPTGAGKTLCFEKLMKDEKGVNT